jgi:hypothetical protein
MSNKATPYYAVLQNAALFYATVDNISLKHLIIMMIIVIFSGSATQRGLWPPRLTHTMTRHSR